jgi:hypothetical protein
MTFRQGMGTSSSDPVWSTRHARHLGTTTGNAATTKGPGVHNGEPRRTEVIEAGRSSILSKVVAGAEGVE